MGMDGEKQSRSRKRSGPKDLFSFRAEPFREGRSREGGQTSGCMGEGRDIQFQTS